MLSPITSRQLLVDANGEKVSTTELDAYRLIELKKHNLLTTVVYGQFEADLGESEMETITEQMQKVTDLNKAFGGSERGYYFENELFAVGATQTSGAISTVDESLYQNASNIKQNRTELTQSLTYVANLLSVLDAMTHDYRVFIANLPTELGKFTDAIRKLESHADRETPDWRGVFKFDRENPEFSTFYLHYDRVDPILKRYLFRRITQ